MSRKPAGLMKANTYELYFLAAEDKLKVLSVGARLLLA